MGRQHCSYGPCNNDSRYEGKRPEIKGVFIIPFPKPKTNFEKCKILIKNSGRKNFGVENNTKHTFALYISLGEKDQLLNILIPYQPLGLTSSERLPVSLCGQRPGRDRLVYPHLLIELFRFS